MQSPVTPERSGEPIVRNHDREHQDNETRRYAYDFDDVIRKYLLSRLEPHLRRDGLALELGCYKGDMTARILDYFPAVTVIEASGELAGIVRARFAGKVTVITSSFENAAIDSKFDNIFIVHTLEHLDDPVGVLAKVRDWLTPEGRLFVAVPNANALSRQLAVKMGLVESNAAVTPAEALHGHRRTYSMETLLAHVRAAGYEVADHGGILVKPLANFQFDKAMSQGIVDAAYLDACQALAKTYPDLSATVFAVCAHPGAPAAQGQ
jgi:SAM-dependent methyltransferase